MIFEHLTVNRIRPFRASLLLLIFIALFASQMNVPDGMAGVAIGSKGPVYDIVPDNALSTLSASSQKATTFYMQGTIYKFRTFNHGDCTPLFSGTELQDRVLGTWRAWGTVADNSGKLVLHQTLMLEDFNSTIEVQGVSGLLAPNGAVSVADTKGNTTGPSEVLSVVGGSGQFRALSGEAVIRPYCNPSPAGTSPFRFDRPFCLGVE
jgi:hypothetical protein